MITASIILSVLSVLVSCVNFFFMRKAHKAQQEAQAALLRIRALRNQ